MKKAIIKKHDNYLRYDSLDGLLANNTFVGFEAEICSGPNRFMVVPKGPDAGLAINYNGTWADKDEQKTETETYYVFGSAKELYEWLAEGEDK